MLSLCICQSFAIMNFTSYISTNLLLILLVVCDTTSTENANRVNQDQCVNFCYGVTTYGPANITLGKTAMKVS